MTVRKTCIVAIAVLVVVGATITFADTPDRKGAPGQGIDATARPAADGVIRAIGTITYDNNVPFQRDGQVDGMVGNNFNGLANPHTLTSVSFRVGGNYGGSVVMSVWEPGTGTASLLRRWLALGVPSGSVATASTVSVPVANRTVSLSTVVSPITNHSASLLIGVRNTHYTGLQCAPPSTFLNSTCDGVALTQGTSTIGFGLHGVRLPFASGGVFFPTITSFGGSGTAIPQNAIMRATGENLPVELMNFTISD